MYHKISEGLCDENPNKVQKINKNIFCGFVETNIPLWKKLETDIINSWIIVSTYQKAS